MVDKIKKVMLVLVILVNNQISRGENLEKILSLDIIKHIENYDSIRGKLSDSTELIRIINVDTFRNVKNGNMRVYIVRSAVKKTNFYMEYAYFSDGFIIPIAAGYGTVLKVNREAFQTLCDAKRLKDYFCSRDSFYTFWADLIIPAGYRIYSFHSKSFIKETRQDELKNEYEAEIQNGASVKQENAFMILYKDYAYKKRQPLALLYFYDDCHYQFTIDHKIEDINTFMGYYDSQMGPLITWKW